MKAKEVFPKEPDFTKWLSRSPKYLVDLLNLCDVTTSEDNLDCYSEVLVPNGQIDIWEDVSATLIEANYGLIDRDHLTKPNHYAWGMSHRYCKNVDKIIHLTEKSDENSREFVKHENQMGSTSRYLVEFNVSYNKNGEPIANFHIIVAPSKTRNVDGLKRKVFDITCQTDLIMTQRTKTLPDFRNHENLSKLQGMKFHGNVGKKGYRQSYTIEWVGPGDLFLSDYGFEGTLNSVGYQTREHIAINVLKKEKYAANGSSWKMIKNDDGLSIDDVLSNN